MWTASTTRVLAGDVIPVTRRFWRIATGKYEYRPKPEGLVMIEQDDRPETCRPGTIGNFYGKCQCGTCLTDTETREMVVDKVTYFADNSIEAAVIDEFNNTYQITLTAPRGDACF
jgi:hypothetical protein